MKKRILVILMAIILVILSIYLLKQTSLAPDSEQNNIDTSKITDDDVDEVPIVDEIVDSSFDKSMYSLTDPSSIWFIANKHFSLPLDYAPSKLIVLDVPLRLSANEQQMQISDVVGTELAQLFKDAKTAGLQLQFGSGYRSASLQSQFYNSYVSQDGRAAADTYSARPGHSEHQTGLTLDFTRVDGYCYLESCFGQQPEGKWLTENAHKYGFILRYPENKEPVTGYIYEPWHYRYVGSELAEEMKKQGILTLEEYFELGPAPDYQ